MDTIEMDGIQLLDNLTYGMDNMTELDYENIPYPAEIRCVIFIHFELLNCLKVKPIKFSIITFCHLIVFI